jgi:hypothetical protein
MKGVLANYRNNQSKRGQRYPAPEKKTLSARADNELQSKGNDDFGDRNPGDDDTTIFEDDIETEDVTAGEIESDNAMEDENNLNDGGDCEDNFREDDDEIQEEEEEILVPVQLTLRTASKRPRKNDDNASPDNVSTKRLRQNKGSRINGPLKTKGKKL